MEFKHFLTSIVSCHKVFYTCLLPGRAVYHVSETRCLHREREREREMEQAYTYLL